ncbi:MAG: flagellar biosynthesis anti-sigma factor FlgM [Acidobacteriaceae bacterium]
MRIDLQFGNTQSVDAQKTSRATSTAPICAERADAAQFSSSASSLSTLAARVLSEPEVRWERVEALRSSIADGSYSVHPQAVAEAMLRDIF